MTFSIIRVCAILGLASLVLGECSRCHGVQVFDINPWKSWGAVLTSIVSFAASLWLISVVPWYLLPVAWFLSGTAFTGVSCSSHPGLLRTASEHLLLKLLQKFITSAAVNSATAEAHSCQESLCAGLSGTSKMSSCTSMAPRAVSCFQAAHESTSTQCCGTLLQHCRQSGECLQSKLDLHRHHNCCGSDVNSHMCTSSSVMRNGATWHASSSPAVAAAAAAAAAAG